MNTPPILPQQQRENPEPHERGRPVPWGMLFLVALMTAFGVAYIATDALDAPSALGDQRDVPELRFEVLSGDDEARWVWRGVLSGGD